MPHATSCLHSIISDVVARHVDVFNVESAEQGLVVHGAAFDDGIDALRAEGLDVKILPDPPGVTR